MLTRELIEKASEQIMNHLRQSEDPKSKEIVDLRSEIFRLCSKLMMEIVPPELEKVFEKHQNEGLFIEPYYQLSSRIQTIGFDTIRLVGWRQRSSVCYQYSDELVDSLKIYIDTNYPGKCFAYQEAILKESISEFPDHLKKDRRNLCKKLKELFLKKEEELLFQGKLERMLANCTPNLVKELFPYVTL